uniref:Putative coenzyme Q synthetase n=1 Tax=Trypanosoma congolense TaxID=5692 RepID=Q6F3E6_TRYCO|nr:putative coenzyme Q synthetase [Trypanosoma congolense]
MKKSLIRGGLLRGRLATYLTNHHHHHVAMKYAFRTQFPSIGSANAQVAAKSRSRKWGRRILFCTCAGVSLYIFVDCMTAHSLTRSLRTVQTMIYIIYLYKVMSPETMEEYSELHQTVAASLLNLFLKNEGLYIKLGQMFTSMNHFLPGEYIDTMKALLDSAPSVPLDDIQQVILEETGKTCEELFVHFDPEPVASASIAQVHRALLQPADSQQDPVEVCVKIQKPYIRRQVFWDLQTYRFVMFVLGAAFNMPVTWAKETIIEGINREVNFSMEAANAVRIKNDFADREDFYVPYVYEHLVTPRLLVMEWVNGVKLIDVDRVRSRYSDVEILRILFDVFGSMIFKKGFVHCDPHGANILVRDFARGDVKDPAAHNQEHGRCSGKTHHKPQLVLLDFGLCCPESECFRVEYAILLKAMMLQDMKTVKKIVGSWGVDDAVAFSSLQLRKSYDLVRRGNYGETTREEAINERMKQRDSIRNLLSNEERLPYELSLIGRSIDILHGVNRLYGAPVNRVGMFARSAVAALGPLSTYEDVQQYLREINDLSGVTNEIQSLSTSLRRKSMSLFDTTLEQQRRQEEAAVACHRHTRGTSLSHRVWEGITSMYCRIHLEVFLLILDVCHRLNQWFGRGVQPSVGSRGEAPLMRR